MLNWFASAFGAAVADIREKVVEEGVYGRTLGGQEPSVPPKEPEPWSEWLKQTNASPAERAPVAASDIGHDIDR